ncbi:phosphonoacetate hydrolase [Fulvivirgaceae bacterium BMA10]|uniref:Phosphonoacetate hydrolase n=1 Tax=Splendidivirga corallicola TaxID=3051826 RepID=A0ABT8KMY5_9BACT|nr:phosphonoacetate hydrolase [Fulvivirgaceae bacterium BMA10]
MKINVNNIDYKTHKAPVVGICMDGTSYDYYEAAATVMPNIQRFLKTGSFGYVESVIPSFTNPNNMAIVTGVTPDKNGICGNYYYDKKTGEEVMMNDPENLKVPTILGTFSQQNKKVAVVTAKDKLRKMLNKGLNGICFSAEHADKVTIEENGIGNVVDDLMSKENPGIYDPEISVYCIEAGARLLEREHFDLMYLTTTDFVQHKYAPGDQEAINFLSRIDRWIGELDRLGAVVGVTADHGMSAKTNSDGSPKVQYLETILLENANISSRVILPITDPYVVHHGALGSYATVYLQESDIVAAKEIIGKIPGIEMVLTREEAVSKFSLPAEMIGELVVLSDGPTVIGRAKSWHDLEKVKSGLRSHGGLHESKVPMIINRPLNQVYKEKLDSGKARNFHLFDFLHNGVEND